jgi:hypothetical protein
MSDRGERIRLTEIGLLLIIGLPSQNYLDHPYLYGATRTTAPKMVSILSLSEIFFKNTPKNSVIIMEKISDKTDMLGIFAMETQSFSAWWTVEKIIYQQMSRRRFGRRGSGAETS